MHSNQPLVVEPSTLSLGQKKVRQRRIRGLSAGLERRAAWMKNGEIELIVPKRAAFERLSSPTLKQKKWPNVYLPIPIIRNNLMVTGLSIPIVRNNRVMKSLSTYFPKQ